MTMVSRNGNPGDLTGRPKWRGQTRAVALTAALAIGLAGCSSLPDWANPVEWYDSTFSEDAAPPPKSNSQAAAEAEAAKTAKAEAAQAEQSRQAASSSSDSGSFWPDWANPSKWFGDMFSDDSPPPPAQAAAKSEEKFPSLKTVPEKAPATMTKQERRKVSDSLVADRSASRYTDEELKAGGTASQVTAAPVKRVQPEAPAPKPVVAVQKPAAPKRIVNDPLASRRVSGKTSRMPKLASAAPQPAPVSAPKVVAAPVSPVAVVSKAPALKQKSGNPPPPAPLPPLVAPAPVAAKSSQTATALKPQLSAAPAPQPIQAPVGSQAVAPTFPTAGQGELARIFAASLAQSASTISTAPANSAFAAPVASPISAAQVNLPANVLEAYNKPLAPGAASVIVNPGQSFSTQPARAKSAKVVVQFSNGSARLNSKSRAVIRAAAKKFKEKGRGVIRVIGHASHRTRDMALTKHRLTNFNVSLDRANVVAKALMRYGVSAQSVRVEAMSDSEPVYFEFMPSGEAKNRRTEIVFES